jgi:acyl-CoA reductase-like NAD-dependent aldehyde dehydrogenase
VQIEDGHHTYLGVYDKFVKRIETRMQAMRQGDSCAGTCDFGSMTMPAQVDLVDGLVQDAITNGARIIKV